MWIIGIDAGGTKTHCIIGDERGNIVSEGFGGAANYQTCGVEKTKQSLQDAIEKALEKAELSLTQIRLAIFGMSGADEPFDYEVLNPLVKGIMGDVPVEIVNDTWIGLRCTLPDNVGVISICGTGASHAGRNQAGKAILLRNLDYLLGNRGGGGELVEHALHFAFRSNEHTYHKTILEEAMLTIFEVETMDEVCNCIRKDGVTSEQAYKIPFAVFEAAKKGDYVSKMLLEDMGYTEGLYAGGLIHRLGMEQENVPVVLVGSLFNTREPLLLDAYMRGVHETAPHAYSIIPAIAPVMGALGLAIDRLKKETNVLVN